VKYTPVQPPEGINVTEEHPLKSFFILTAGTIAVIIAIVVILGLSADYLVKYIPVEYEQDVFSKEKLYLVPFASDETEEGIQAKEYVQNLVDELHTAAGEELSEHKFQVEIADDNETNAFAVPGGHIVVTRGLFSSVKSENGLSMILAHEMAHHYKRHPLRSTGRGLVVSIFLLAGHASGAAEFFQFINLEQGTMTEIPAFLSTHPATQGRINYLIELENKNSGDKKPLPEFIKEYANSEPILDAFE